MALRHIIGYVEKEELEQTWKACRRQRLKQQEQKIWDQFVQEQDVVRSICKDDPYQFLHELPEACIKELLEEELQKMQNEQAKEKGQHQEQDREAGASSPVNVDNQHVVTFVEVEDREDMFHIFDDEKDDDVSGPEEEVLNDSMGSPPLTVRERNNRSPVKSVSPDKASSKSSENVSNMIESSIYCAKVKELRIKINEELMDIASTLERLEPRSIDPEEMGRLTKRSGEFCARFNRIYLYQLHRQVQEVVRGANTAAALPFARHTQFQSQMVRVVSLHQNMLQTAQIFHRSIGQTACVRDSGEALRTLLRTVREAGAAARDTTPPAGLAAAQQLYTDDVEDSCTKLEETLNEYTDKLKEYVDEFEHTGKPRKAKYKGKRKMAPWSKSGSKSGTETEGRLSMYSLDTLRLNLQSKSTISKGHSSGTSKVRGGLSSRRPPPAPHGKEPRKSPKKSPRSRRPLMRDPAAGQPRRRAPRDLDVPTLVETVAACTSSHISREETPQQTPRDSNTTTPRRKDGKKTHRKHHSRTPRKKSKSPRKNSAKDKKTDKSNKPDKQTDKPDDVTPKPAEPLVKDVEQEEKHDVTKDKHVEMVEKSETLTEHEIRVEVKPKPPEKLIESTLKAAKEHMERAQKLDAHDSKRSNKSDMSTEIKIGWQEIIRMQRHRERERERETASPRYKQDSDNDGRRSDRDKYRFMEVPGSCEVSKLLRQLCGGDSAGSKNERVMGVKNAQLLCMTSSGSPRQPSTPQLLRILEETIQKKVPKPQGGGSQPQSARDAERLRLALGVPERTLAALLSHRTQFVQHMLASCMYTNSAVGKPWEVIGSISDQIIDELLLKCAKEMELTDIIQELYDSETR